ncbi:rod shape-determining protein MreD [Rhodobacteraceae bacterium NNCM2]|nr:rod shape-determining protein MreD [Coraliihabitans acroporae]
MAAALDRESIFRVIRMLIFTALGLLAIFIEAAPAGIEATSLPSPDLLLCVVAFWVLRRPGSTPLLLVFALGLCRDLLTDAPLGAGTLGIVLAAQVLTERRNWIAAQPFVVEWMMVGLAIAFTLILQWVLVVVTLGHPPYLRLLLIMAGMTFFSYPVVAVVFRWLLGISWRKGDGLTRSGV